MARNYRIRNRINEDQQSMDFSWSFKGYKTNWLEMSLQEKDWSRLEDWNLQNASCCQGILSKGRYRLWWNFSRGNAQINSDYFCYSSILWSWNMKWMWEMSFLNGELKKGVYMTQLKGFTSLFDHNKVYKFQWFIYGSKQVCRSWNIHFNKIIEWFNLVSYEEVLCEYKRSVGALYLYVDDI